MKLRRIFPIVISLILLSGTAFSEDYQYQYFSHRDEYVPFSDYIPRVRMHYYTVPHYLEDYYLLFGMKLYYNESSLRKNIEMLKTSLNCKFRHPSQALVAVDTEDEYLKYRKLMFMHINIMIMRNYLKIGSKYDKIRVKFYDAPFAKENIESIDIAIKLYRDALPYWMEAKKHAEAASRIKITTRMSNIETERFRIVRGELDFRKIINNHIASSERKKRQLEKYLASNP
ncbi:MAG TPA: hypothetical protein PK358_01670 [Spirochaetota bacterium]|nr:hypothetical protein [Spirochaetota bacterium]HPJ33511.1 hypothetical protein [Spirochaetota bacterium]